MAQVTNPAPMKVADSAIQVPFPRPKNKAEKEANGIARNKRREANRKARREAEEAAEKLRVEALTPEQREAEIAAAKAKAAVPPIEKPVEHALIDEDKPVISYDDKADDEKPTESYCSDDTPGVAAIPETTTRNDPPEEANDNEAPAEEAETITTELPKLSRKKRRQAIYQAKVKARKEAAAKAEAEKPAVVGEYPETTINGEPVDEEIHVDEALVQAGSFDNLPKEGADETVSEVPTESPVAEPVVDPAPDTGDVPVTEPVAEPNNSDDVGRDGVELTNDSPVVSSAESTVGVVEEEVTDEPAIEETPVAEPVSEEVVPTEPVVEETTANDEPVVEETTPTTTEPVVEPVTEPVPDSTNVPVPDKPDNKPVLKLVSDNPNDPKVVAARKFYGDAFTPERAEKLAKALFWLDKAIEAELAGDMGKMKLAFKAAHRNEGEALGYDPDFGYITTMAMAA